MSFMKEFNDLLKKLKETEDKKEVYQSIFPYVYEELLQVAKNIRFRWQGDLTLNTTSLVHETYLKMTNQKEVNIENRKHFFAIANQAMKQILINHAQAKIAKKRGGEKVKVELENIDISLDLSEQFSESLLALNEALEVLKRVNERQSKVVSYRFFTGLTLEDTAQLLEVSERTVKRDWNNAKVWLYQYMNTY